MNSHILQHPRLGRLELCPNARARRFTFRPTAEGLRVTTPIRFSEADLNRCLSEMEPRLLQLRQRFQQKQAVRRIDADFRIDTPHFKMELQEGRVAKTTARFKGGVLTITYPKDVDFENEALQAWLVKVAEEALRHQGMRVFLPRITQLAAQYGFSFEQLKIHKTHGRWGSCSTRKHINLSLYLLLLPESLQDYVMLHELCHTKEMNHGPRFWALLDAATGGKAQQLRQAMKAFDTSIFCTR